MIHLVRLLLALEVARLAFPGEGFLWGIATYQKLLHLTYMHPDPFRRPRRPTQH